MGKVAFELKSWKMNGIPADGEVGVLRGHRDILDRKNLNKSFHGVSERSFYESWWKYLF